MRAVHSLPALVCLSLHLGLTGCDGSDEQPPQQHRAVTHERDSPLDGLFSLQPYSVEDRELILKTYEWLSSPSFEKKRAPGLSPEAAAEKLRRYFGQSRRIRSAEQLGLLQYTFAWLRDSGMNFWKFTDRRGPLLSISRSLSVAEDWVLADVIRSEYEVDVLHEAAMRHYQEPRAAIFPFLDHLARSGQASEWAKETLSGDNGEEAFQAWRARLEVARLEQKPASDLLPEEKERLADLRGQLSAYEGKDIGLFFYSRGAFEAFSKSDAGIALQGEPYHPRDTDTAWKRERLSRALGRLELPDEQQTRIAKTFLDTENYGVNALDRLIAYTTLLAQSPPRGIGLAGESLDAKLEEYRRLPIKNAAGIERIHRGWQLAQKFAPKWLRARRDDVFLENIGVLGYAKPEEFWRLLSIVDLHVAQARSDEWAAIYEEESPFGWRRDPKPLDKAKLPNCRRDVERLVRSMPAPPWGYTQEVESARKTVCTEDMLRFEKAVIAEIEEDLQRQQLLHDATRLLARVSDFISKASEELSDAADADNSDHATSEVHVALSLIRVHSAGRRVRERLERAHFFSAALRSAENELGRLSAEGPVREMNPQMRRVSAFSDTKDGLGSQP